MSYTLNLLREIAAHPIKTTASTYEQLKIYRNERFAAKSDANRLIKQLAPGERALFIDGGSNLGQGMRFFSRYFTNDYFDYALFEPNPNCKSTLEAMLQGNFRNAILVNSAISTSEGTTQFFGIDETEGGKVSQGGSIISDHESAHRSSDSEKSISVKTIDIAKYLQEQHSDYRFIALKLDIEGAELDVLEHLLSTGAIKHIDALYVEFHSQYLAPELQQAAKDRENSILKSLDDLNIPFHVWH